jgi:hypothetical protein
MTLVHTLVAALIAVTVAFALGSGLPIGVTWIDAALATHAIPQVLVLVIAFAAGHLYLVRAR